MRSNGRRTVSAEFAVEIMSFLPLNNDLLLFLLRIFYFRVERADSKDLMVSGSNTTNYFK